VRIAYLAYHGTQHTRRWVSWFADRGHDVVVVTCGDNQVLEEFGHYEVRDVGPPRLGKLGYLLRMPAVRRILASLDVDLVHAHQATSYGLLASVSARSPYVVTAHGSDILVSARSPVMRPLVRQALRGADLVTVPSEEMGAIVRDLAGPDKRVLIMQYGVETDRLAQIAADVRQSSVGEPGVLRIASARPLFKLYRFDSLVSALGLLAGRGVAFTCDLFDEGPEYASLLLQIESLGLSDRVSLLGLRPEAVVMETLARSDVYVSLAESDGASIALLEAMALGAVPVLADIPANRAWVRHGENGVLTQPDPSSVAKAIELAASLDRPAVAAGNLALVAERADRARNLSILEDELAGLVGKRVSAARAAAGLTG
jgi:glycosyltransferase involved in cell wall biosynthesis